MEACLTVHLSHLESSIPGPSSQSRKLVVSRPLPTGWLISRGFPPSKDPFFSPLNWPLYFP